MIVGLPSRMSASSMPLTMCRVLAIRPRSPAVNSNPVPSRRTTPPFSKVSKASRRTAGAERSMLGPSFKTFTAPASLIKAGSVTAQRSWSVEPSCDSACT